MFNSTTPDIQCVNWSSNPTLTPDKAAIIAFMEANFNAVELSLEAALWQRYRLSAYDFRLKQKVAGKYTSEGNRIAKAWQIVRQGGWKWPEYAGGPFLLDSQQADAGNYAYPVYCAAIPTHRGNQCICTDASFLAEHNCKGLCKHILAAHLLYIGCSLFASHFGNSEIDRARLAGKEAIPA